MHQFPPEIIGHILAHLDYRNLSHAQWVCRWFQAIINSVYFWRHKFHLDFPRAQVNPVWRCHLDHPNSSLSFSTVRLCYLHQLTRSGGCERGSETFISLSQCLDRVMMTEDDDHDLIEYFLDQATEKIEVDKSHDLSFLVRSIHGNLRVGIDFRPDLSVATFNRGLVYAARRHHYRLVKKLIRAAPNWVHLAYVTSNLPAQSVESKKLIGNWHSKYISTASEPRQMNLRARISRRLDSYIQSIDSYIQCIGP
jgi:hypothetical protein